MMGTAWSWPEAVPRIGQLVMGTEVLTLTAKRLLVRLFMSLTLDNKLLTLILKEPLAVVVAEAIKLPLSVASNVRLGSGRQFLVRQMPVTVGEQRAVPTMAIKFTFWPKMVSALVFGE